MTEELKNVLAEFDQLSFHEFIEKYQPYDLAEMVTNLNYEDQIAFFETAPQDLGAEIIEFLEPELQYRIMDHLADDSTITLLNDMSSDKVVDLLLAIHPHQAKILMEFLPEDYREKIKTLMTYEANTAGSLATVDYIGARKSWTIDFTLQHIRKVGHDAELVSYIYVIDTHGKLVGVVSLKDIILQKPTTTLEEIIKEDVISVSVEMHQEEVADILTKYDLVAIPVLTKDHRMIGIITVDDLIDVIHEEATEDIQKLGGSQPLVEPYFKNSVWSVFRKRIGWLLILFVAEAYTGNVLRHYEDTLEEVIALAFFVPLLLGTGGNTGTQTVTTLVRAMAVGEVQFKDFFRVMRKEITTGVFLGLAMGIVTLIRAQILGVGFDIGTVVAITAIFIVIWASFVAAILPLILHKLKVDPAVVSGPFITTFVDGTGLIIYFTLARVMLNL
ncbi:magnesium transporter [Lederbergia citrea]|uniref:Magnesium transporter MgtE n=1 Tax=Lederbergia citrea TaxID=2833581 RepID=A0A942Z717_9BACI|nr:magnesium transporter [Lederbergia citrea]MBS4205895.1 magnesium transporter [Lederbergia citrea]MBS4224656.1 magnesium transporter [Lederbergia citrea]